MEEENKELEELEKAEGEFHFPWIILIIVGVFAILMAICIVMIYCFGGPTSK